jgi:hypothetical protein
MDKINPGHEKISHSDEKEIVVPEELAYVPGNKKKPTADHYAEGLDQTVEQYIAVQARDVETNEYRNSQRDSPAHPSIGNPRLHGRATFQGITHRSFYPRG